MPGINTKVTKGGDGTQTMRMTKTTAPKRSPYKNMGTPAASAAEPYPVSKPKIMRAGKKPKAK